MLSALWSILLFLIAIVLLVSVHEFGHFIVARWCKVKVLRFSVGFGKPLWSFVDKKGTEFVLASIPLGGYVRMVDEREGTVTPQDLPYAFNRQPPLAKIAIVCAGPLFNFLFAIFAFWTMYVVGYTTIAPIVGKVDSPSIAKQAGIKPNEEIIAVNNEKTDDWQDVRLAILAHLGENGALKLTLKDLATASVQTHTLQLLQWGLTDEQLVLKSLGIEPFFPAISPIIMQVMPDSPASQALLAPQDKIMAVDDIPITDWQQMVEYITKRPNQTVKLTLQRNEQPLTIAVQVGSKNVGGQVIGYLGVQSVMPQWPSEFMRKKQYSLFGAFVPAVQKTWDMTTLSFSFLWKMIVGELSVNNMSGPIGIAQGAGYSASLGFSYFMSYLALISLSLAIINVLPIPVLDGGHLVYYLYELITKKTVPEKVQVIATQIGIFLLLAVMMLAFYNDIMRW